MRNRKGGWVVFLSPLLLPSLLLSPSPSSSGTLWTRSRLPPAYLSKMADSALAPKTLALDATPSIPVNN